MLKKKKKSLGKILIFVTVLMHITDPLSRTLMHNEI